MIKTLNLLSFFLLIGCAKVGEKRIYDKCINSTSGVSSGISGSGNMVVSHVTICLKSKKICEMYTKAREWEEVDCE